MLNNLIYLLPVICVALGGMVALAAEPFLSDETSTRFFLGFLLSLSLLVLLRFTTQRLVCF